MADRADGREHEVDERFRALMNNANAARVVAQAVEGTIGPKGLDTMMVDSFGDVIITNDGVTILKEMEISHPAAMMIINAAKAQQDTVGDGTTTATIMAAAMIAEGANHILKGVPVAKILEGIQIGVKTGLESLQTITRPIADENDPALRQVAKVAGRGVSQLADLIISAVPVAGRAKLLQPGFHLAESVTALAGSENMVLEGVIVNRRPVNRDMPESVDNALILVLDDYLRPEDLDEALLQTESGYRTYMERKEQYSANLARLKELGINAVFTARAVDDQAEEVLAESGIMTVQRVSYSELERIAQHTGAKILKRGALNRDAEILRRGLGQARRIEYHEELNHLRVLGGLGEPVATIVVGAATAEIAEERERVARDAAASVQAALKSGVLPGGGAAELWCAAQLGRKATEAKDMASYGILCVKEALERPFTCIVANAGLNPLEKLVEAVSVQQETNQAYWAVDCDDGRVVNLAEAGVFDPTLVKIKALESAGEVAAAILRISTVVKKRDTARRSGGHTELI